jgi:hypothetical protein
MNYVQQEENNYPRAFAATSVIMVLIAALCYFWIISMPPKQEDVAANTKKPSNTVATSLLKRLQNQPLTKTRYTKAKPITVPAKAMVPPAYPGNQGKPTGTTLTNNYNGTGSGNGGNLNLTQRSFVTRPSVDGGNRYTGKVVVDIRVDKEGNVIQATAGARGTTITDATLLQKCDQQLKK